MALTGISLLGWVHTLACLTAIVTGAYVLAAPKGTRHHRVWGWCYAAAMVIQSLLVMGIYHFDVIPGRHLQSGPGLFGLFHLYALVEVVAIGLAVYSARKMRGLWAYVHPQAMLFSYYLLINGLA